MRIFISMGMEGKTENKIQGERKEIEDLCHRKFGKDIEFVGSNFKEDSLFNLGENLKVMASCDVLVQSKDAFNYRGCNVEDLAASLYSITRYTYSELYLLPTKFLK